MTTEQLNYLDFSVNIQWRVLKLVKEQYFNNENTDAFIELIDETKRKIIWDLENFFLLPNYTFNPLTRNFQDTDNVLRKEIANEVNICFENFKRE